MGRERGEGGEGGEEGEEGEGVRRGVGEVFGLKMPENQRSQIRHWIEFTGCLFFSHSCTFKQSLFIYLCISCHQFV